MTSKNAPLILALALIPLLAAGCFMSRERVNQSIDPNGVEQLVPGESTAADVTAALGAPMHVVQLGYRQAWRYDFTHTKTAGLVLIVFNAVNSDIQQDRVWVFFDEDEILSHIGTTFEAGDAEYAMPWSGRDD